MTLRIGRGSYRVIWFGPLHLARARNRVAVYGVVALIRCGICLIISAFDSDDR
jgi:hypothetical protein